MQIIDQLTDKLLSSPKVPLSNNRLVDAAEFTQLLDRLRINVPSSIRDSERTLAERERILAQADEEARRILALAQRRAAELVAADALVQSARREAERLMEEARQAAMRSAEDADAYAEYVLNAINDTLANAGGQVTNGLSELSLRRADRAASMGAPPQGPSQTPGAPPPTAAAPSGHAPAQPAPLPPARQAPNPRRAAGDAAQAHAPLHGEPQAPHRAGYSPYEAKG